MKELRKREVYSLTGKMRSAKVLQGMFLWGLLFLILMVLGPERAAGASDPAYTIRFLSAEGKEISGFSPLTLKKGETVTLPAAPKTTGQFTGTAAWKPAAVYETGMTLLKSKGSLSYAAAEKLMESYGKNNVLTLYGTKPCRVRFLDNTGQKVLGSQYAYEGARIRLQASPNARNTRNYKGWSSEPNGGTFFQFEESYQVSKEVDFFLIWYVYAAFRNSDGTNGDAFNVLTEYVKKGKSVTLPEVPYVYGYRGLGWSTVKESAAADYTPGQSLVMTRNMTFYAVRKYLPYLVKYTDNAGKDSSDPYKKLYERVSKYQVITFPALPAVTGYVALGWSDTPGSATAKYKAGEMIKVTKNVTFYAVYRKAKRFAVTFYMGDGSSSDLYTGLRQVVWEGTYLTLPAVPARSGYKNIGWMLSVNGTTKYYKAGKKVKISGNYRFYANQKELLSIVLHDNSGKVLSTHSVAKGDSFTLPSMENPKGYTFMGWGTKAKTFLSPANPKKPAYEAREQIASVSKTMHLYMVLFKRSTEGSTTLGALTSALNKAAESYSRIIILGDSRTVYLKRTLQNMSFFSTGTNADRLTFIGKTGQGLKWLKEDGYARLLKEVKKTEGQQVLPIAVIFNLGVNDQTNLNSYITYMKSIAPELTGLNCRLFFMSINPLNGAQGAAYAKSKGVTKSARNENSVRVFNSTMRTALNGIYSYLDVYSWLMETGYSTDAGMNGHDSGEDDGGHYAVNTYKRILNRCLWLLVH